MVAGCDPSQSASQQVSEKVFSFPCRGVSLLLGTCWVLYSFLPPGTRLHAAPVQLLLVLIPPWQKGGWNLWKMGGFP